MIQMTALLFSRPAFVVGILFSLLAALGALAEEKPNFATHPLFRHLIGEWKSAGTLTKPDGSEIKMVEEWTGRATTEGSFVMDGFRLIDSEKQEYTWTFTHNPATGLYEAAHHMTSNGGETKRFEVSVSEVELTMELRLVGDNLSSITVKDSFADKDMDTLNSEVTLTGSGGETTISGKLTHKRLKMP